MNKKILILGGTGQLGNTLTRYLIINKKFTVISTCKNKKKLNNPILKPYKNHFYNLNVKNQKKIESFFKSQKPDFVINCIGLVKQKINSKNIKDAIYLNSILPNFLSNLSNKYKFKLILISTDCVFSGKKGNYNEEDVPDPADVYGQTKSLGEILNNKQVLTLRTSYVGHEIDDSSGLLEWILKQKNVSGFKNAFFTGLPTIELSEIIGNYFIKKKNIYGLYNIAGQKISKHDFLKKIIKVYDLDVNLSENINYKVDRSLNASKFQQLFDYKPVNWIQLAKKMRKFN